MSKLVILNQGMAGRTFDLTAKRYTVGRLEDNTIHIPDASVSSHHAEIVVAGNDIFIVDVGSTNGTFLNNQKVHETLLKPGEILKFGSVELKIDDGKPLPAPPPPPPPPAPVASAPPPPPAPLKKAVEGTMVISRGVSLEQLEQGGTRAPGFDTTGTGFSKKGNKVNTYFIVGGIVVGLVIVALIVLAIKWANTSLHP
jgi:hypothetical protein